MNGAVFLRTLRNLGFSEFDKYTSDFDLLFSDPVLQQFLDYICTFNEDNVLTTEELKAYTAISPEELAELENLAYEEKSCVSEQIEDEKEDEAEFLKDHLIHIEKRYKALLEQKELLIQHQSFVLNEKEKCQNEVLKLKRNYDDYILNRIPAAESKLSTTLQSVSEVITELKTCINLSDDKNSHLNLKNTEDYFEEEEKVVNFIESFIQNNFQVQSQKNLDMNRSAISNKKLLKEISVLNNVLKNSKLSELQVLCDCKKEKAVENFFKNYDDGVYSQITEASSVVLSMKLNEELQENKKLKEKEKQLISYVSNAISDHLKAQCSEIAIAHSNDILLVYKQYMKTIEFPLHRMLEQRSCLELLISFVSSHQNNLKNIKLFINEIADFLSFEENLLLERKEKLKECCEKIPVKENNLPQSSVFLSCYKILTDAQNSEADSVTLPDVIAEIERLNKQNEILVTQKKDKNDVIKSLENHYSDTAKYVSKGKEFSKFMKSEKAFSIQVNHLDLLATEMHKVFTGFQDSWMQKNKILETKRNLQFARSLYILALLDEKKFEEAIKRIQKASETSVDSLNSV